MYNKNVIFFVVEILRSEITFLMDLYKAIGVGVPKSKLV